MSEPGIDRELGKESISRDQAQRHTMFIVWEMQRCEQRKIQDPGSKPAENGILSQVRKVFKKKRVNNIKRIGDFDNKGKALTGVGSKENSRNRIQNTRCRKPIRAAAGGTKSESKEGFLIDIRNDSSKREHPIVKGKQMIWRNKTELLAMSLSR